MVRGCAGDTFHVHFWQRTGLAWRVCWNSAGLLHHVVEGVHTGNTGLLLRLSADRRCAAVLGHDYFELLAQVLERLLCVSVLSLLDRCGVFARGLERGLARFEICQQRVVLLAHLHGVLRGLLCRFIGRSLLLFGQTLLLSGGSPGGARFFGLGLGGLGLGTAALERPADGGNGTAKHGSANKALDVLLAGFWVRNVQASLQALKRLLGNLRDAFAAHGHACLGGVVHSRLAQRLTGDGLGLLSGELGAHGTEQLAHTGQQRHCGGVDQCLRNGRSGGFAEAGFFQRLAGLHLPGQVGAGELARRHSACAQQTQTRRNGNGHRSGQSRQTSGGGSSHIRQ